MNNQPKLISITVPEAPGKTTRTIRTGDKLGQQAE